MPDSPARRPRRTGEGSTLHLSARHRGLIESLLRKHLPDVEAWAYGSRVNGQSHEGSDLDLVLRGPGLKRIATAALGDFEDALRESNVPFLVEVHDWAWLPEEFHREIERTHVVLSPGKDAGRPSGPERSDS